MNKSIQEGIGQRLQQMAELVLSELSSVSQSAQSELQGLQNRDTKREIMSGPEHLITGISKIYADWDVRLKHAVREPFISIVRVECGGREILQYLVHRHGKYLSNYSPKSPNTFLCNYLAPAGKVAATPLGGFCELPNGEEVEVIDKNLFVPALESDWDALHNQITTDEGNIQIPSLRELLSSDPETLIYTPSQQSFERKPVSSAELRDQPVLDSAQDEIFRLPLNSRMIVTGAPGTGKTTLMIKRLAQKTSTDNLSDDEAVLITNQDEGLFHSQNWTLFVPSEGLKNYLKSAMDSEGISSKSVSVWAEESLRLAEKVFQYLSLSAQERGKQKKFLLSNEKILSASSSAELSEVAEDFVKEVETKGGNDIENVSVRFIRKIPEWYGSFRRARVKDGFYASGVDVKDVISQKALSSDEIDIINFAILKYACLIAGKKKRTKEGYISEPGEYLSSILALQKTQIAVDEAADFSAVQLGCMYFLANQQFRSFTIVGDLMQRMTTRGLQDFAECKLFASDLKVQQVGKGYRQSKELAEISASLYGSSIGEESSFFLDVSHANKSGHPPLLYFATSSDDGVEWIADRTAEICDTCDEVPAIAVVVPDKRHVKSMVSILNECLFGITVHDCADGRIESVEGGGLYVFPVQHIKGFEFEGVFLAGIGRMAEMSPSLVDKYLYVAITRSSRFLGIVCREENEFPETLSSVRKLFVEDGIWK